MNAKVYVVQFDSADVIATSVCAHTGVHFFVTTAGTRLYGDVYTASGTLYTGYTATDLGTGTLSGNLGTMTQTNVFGEPVTNTYYYMDTRDNLYHICVSQDHGQ